MLPNRTVFYLAFIHLTLVYEHFPISLCNVYNIFQSVHIILSDKSTITILLTISFQFFIVINNAGMNILVHAYLHTYLIVYLQ